jgi:hypothetical protein
MRIAPLVVAGIAGILILGGCAVDEPLATDPPVVEPTLTPTPTPEGPLADDPAGYPVDLANGFGGVQFSLAAGQLRCAIYDPSEETEFSSAPFFGCVVSAPDFPYPPMDGGPLGSANGFVSNGHGAGRMTQVTDATIGGSEIAPALAAGHSLTWSTVTCEALAADEVRCVDAESGHGVRVSVRDYELF